MRICTEKQKTIIYLGVFIIFLLTSILHFLYEFTDIFIFSLFSAINESVWEHIKISFYAGLFYGLFEYYNAFYKNGAFIFGKALGLLSMTIFIPTVFYTYTNILGTNILWVDILISFLAGALSQLITAYFACRQKYEKYEHVGLAIIAILVLLFTLFTYYPPDFDIFKSA